MGDVVRATALAEGIKKKYPDSELIWMTMNSAKFFVESNPFTDRVLEYNDENVCSDVDDDTCDDCSDGSYGLDDDGWDYDGDGACDAGDDDDDNDSALDENDIEGADAAVEKLRPQGSLSVVIDKK